VALHHLAARLALASPIRLTSTNSTQNQNHNQRRRLWKRGTNAEQNKKKKKKKDFSFFSPSAVGNQCENAKNQQMQMQSMGEQRNS
jgi:hypothetical protein